jgi:tetratricopeptide (TPR) repeat protein
MTRILTIDDALHSLLRHPILVLGPSATSPPSMDEELKTRILSSVPMDDKTKVCSFRDLVDVVRHKRPDAYAAVRESILDYFRTLRPNPQVHHLASGQWSGIVSLVIDSTFEDLLRQRLDQTPTSLTLTVIDHHSTIPPPRTIPVYKLMGSINERRTGRELAIGTSEYLARKQFWSRLLATLPDVARNAPLFFVGTATSFDVARDFVGAMFASSPPYPSRLIFLAGDGTVHDSTFQALVQGQCEITLVDATLKDFCEAASRVALVAGTLSPTTAGTSNPKASALSQFMNIIDHVPSSLPDAFHQSSNQRRLLDGLFRPTQVDWAPFLCDLDLPRTQTSQLFDEVKLKTQYLEQHPLSLIVLRGEAGIGKTICLKRLAVDIAKAGFSAWWCKRAPFGTTRHSYSDFARALARDISKPGKASPPVVVFCDDPYSLRVEVNDIFRAFETAKLPLVLVVASRNSDLVVSDAAKVEAFAKPDFVMELSPTLDDTELASLPSFLLKLGAAANIEDARRQVSEVPTRDSSDILCSLWYLLPETKSQLSASIQDEYFRLGGVSGALSAFASRASSLSDTVRRAYEFVAVTSKLQIGCPLEVLVRALGITYEQWMQMCVDQRPVWGLLYDDVDPESDNIVFHTRNHIVTRVLLELVNGGGGHAGEFRVLKSLVGACDTSTVPYREFLVDLFVSKRSQLAETLSYDWGVELFELALSTFPTQDRTLEHHFGWWHRWVGKRTRTAYEQYQKALDTPEYQYATRRELKEHIHTSMAATVVEMVRQGEKGRQDALELIRMHLQEANTGSFVDPYSDHVFANSLFQLSRLGGPGSADSVSLESVAEALRTIERSLQTIGSTGRQRKDFYENIAALHELQANIVEAIRDVEQAKQFALEAFSQSGSQSGFEVVGRRLLHDAERTRKGGDYKLASEYVSTVMALVEDRGKEVSAELRSVRIDVFVRWRLQQNRGPIDWESLRADLEIVVADRRFQNDLVKHYYLAVALFHLGEITHAQAIFRALQRKNPAGRVRFGRRNVFVGKEGLPRREQGDLRVVHDRTYVFFSGLSLELEVSGNVQDRQAGATVHCYIVFTLTGIFAVFDPPGKDEFLMA